MSRSSEPRTKAVVLMVASSGVQVKLERARRKRSVELMMTLSPWNWTRMPVSTGTVLLTGDRDGRLVDGLSEGGGVHLTQFRRHHGQIRIFAFRHELHGEGRLARRDGHRGTISGKIGFRSGQRLGDVGKQFAQHQNATGLIHAGFDVMACGNGVVEGGKLECAVNGFQTDARQNRGCGTCVDDTCGPCHGIGKSLGIDFDFHGVFLVSFDPHAILAIRATTTKAWGIPRITRMTMKVRKTYFRNNKPCG